MLKKFISTLVLICVMTCCFSFNVFAETTVDDEIALMNLYTLSLIHISEPTRPY